MLPRRRYGLGTLLPESFVESLCYARSLLNRRRLQATLIPLLPLVVTRRAMARAIRLSGLRGMTVPAVADGPVLTTHVTRVFQAFANTPLFNRLFGSVTVAKVTPHAPAIDTVCKWANANGLLHPCAAANHANAAADRTEYQRTASQRQGYLALALAMVTKQERVRQLPRRGLRNRRRTAARRPRQGERRADRDGGLRRRLGECPAASCTCACRLQVGSNVVRRANVGDAAVNRGRASSLPPASPTRLACTRAPAPARFALRPGQSGDPLDGARSQARWI